MHPHSSALLREMSLQREDELRRTELVRQIEYALQEAAAETRDTARRERLVNAVSHLFDRLPARWIRPPRPMEPINS